MDEALEQVANLLDMRQSLEGLDQLRAGLMINLDSEVLAQIQQGEWCLIKAEADYGYWQGAEAVFQQAVLELMNNPPEQPTRTARIFRLVDSVTGEPLPVQAYIATIDGIPNQRRTDAQGIAHLFTDDQVRQLSLRIFNV
ncbi:MULTISPECIES: hypothetical protein [Pseudomonas]|uniref:hypothetical protein n=1 Tax=Pseudomonas TaxID=286 RepID=UPI00209FFE47|nr:hypothetical protein [Pseudomonas koreensis]